MKRHASEHLFTRIRRTMAVLTIFAIGAIAVFLPYELRKFFTNEAFHSIELAQNLFIGGIVDSSSDMSDNGLFRDSSEEDIRKVHHLFYWEGQLYMTKLPSVELSEKMMEDGRKQQEEVTRYHSDIGKDETFYVIRKSTIGNHSYILISYLGANYRNALVMSLLEKILLFLLITVLAAQIPAYFLSKHISKPLESLEKKVDRLAEGDWETPINLQRKDEIGRLADSVENLRKTMCRQDESEKTFLQNISHELKTPVMVIQSYAEALKDGIHPKGTAEASLDVIMDESERLQQKISNLLLYNKIEFMKSHGSDEEELRLDRMSEEVLERFRMLRPNVVVEAELSPAVIRANREGWQALLENLMDNQFRYAERSIRIRTEEDADEIRLTFENDGARIPEEKLGKLFEKFEKGDGGNFGLGLAIAKSVAENSRFSILAENTDFGVRFTLSKKKTGGNA